MAVENLLKRFDATCDLFPLLRLLLPGHVELVAMKMQRKRRKLTCFHRPTSDICDL